MASKFIMGHHIGFVGTRFAGNDGVSLESAKWAEVLWDHEHISYWFAGRLDRHPSVSKHVPHAYFGHPDIEWINDRVWGTRQRTPEVTRLVYALSDHLKQTLYEFTSDFDIEILIVENALCIPMNLPLGLALTNFIAETAFPTIAHHHDFYWERDRFSVNAVGDLLGMAFPPALPSIQHVTINSFAQQALSHRKGESSILVPNVLDFENRPDEPDDYAKQFRADVGLAPDDIVFLQPTRVVPRKGIEHSINLIQALNNPKCKLIISHESGDEGHGYLDSLQETAQRHNVEMLVVSDHIDEERYISEEGRRIYTLADAYSQADFITYPSLYEGFGNALLESFYYEKPILVNRYSIFITDIEPRGFKVITMDGMITREVVAQVQQVIEDPEYREQMVRHNYELSRLFFSFSVLRRKLRAIVTNFTGADDL